MGPLGGLAAALHHARDEGYEWLLTCGVDSLGLPEDLPDLLRPAPAFIASQPIIGLWPSGIAGTVEDILHGEGSHSLRRLADAIGARAQTWARERFALARQVNEMSDLYESFAEG